MSRRGIFRVSLPRAPRNRRSDDDRSRQLRFRDLKRALKHAALRDCGRRCVYCARRLDAEMATLDHVHPVARGGTFHPGNVVTACAPCNRLKGDMLPHEFFARYPWAGVHFMRYARAVHRIYKRGARRAVSLAYAA